MHSTRYAVACGGGSPSLPVVLAASNGCLVVNDTRRGIRIGVDTVSYFSRVDAGHVDL